MRSARLGITFFVTVVIAVGLFGCQRKSWRDFTSPEGDFTVLLPGAPSLSKDRHKITAMSVFDMFNYDVSAGRKQYRVTYAIHIASDLKTADFDEWFAFDVMKNYTSRQLGGRITKENVTELSGRPALDYVVDWSGGSASCFVFKRGDKVFQIMIAAPETVDVQEDRRLILDSLRFGVTR